MIFTETTILFKDEIFYKFCYLGGKDDFECPIKINGGEILLKTFSKNGRFMAAYCQ